ncbi:MAG: endo alpha-1,4 polygalactosaminidase [Methanobacteriaceae archaeon]|nr:endo alpha-1,4 polygalactosaminidase [Methanobacteriaceae archaeon]
MNRSIQWKLFILLIILLSVSIFTISLIIEPVNASQNNHIDEGSKLYYDYKVKSDVKYSFKTYFNGKNRLKIEGYNYYYKSKDSLKKDIYLDKQSKYQIKVRIMYNGKLNTSRYIKTHYNLKKYYWKVYRRKLLSTNKPLKLSKVKYWAYQLQNIEKPGNIRKLASSKYDLLVIEPTQTVSGDEKFNTRKVVSYLKKSKAHDGLHRKLVLAYIDIGQAENYRWYWKWSKKRPKGKSKPKDWPSYILAPDSEGWSGNYMVAYWDDQWKDLIIYGNNQKTNPYWKYQSMIDEVLRAGFDGVYLDWVEAYENPEVIKAAKKAGKNPKVEMIKFIEEIRHYAKSKNPNFIIIQQNAVSLASGHSKVYSLVDGIAQESVWYDWNNYKDYDISTNNQLTLEYIKYLNQYIKAGKLVLNCEYALKKAENAYKKSRKRGFIPYCSVKLLDRLSSTPPWKY